MIFVICLLFFIRHHLELIRKEADLSGIHVVDAETRWIVKAGEDVMSNASRLLLQGMETQNQAEVAAALQVFYNLGTLTSKVDSTLSVLTEKVYKSISSLSLINMALYQDPQKGKIIVIIIDGK